MKEEVKSEFGIWGDAACIVTCETPTEMEVVYTEVLNKKII